MARQWQWGIFVEEKKLSPDFKWRPADAVFRKIAILDGRTRKYILPAKKIGMIRADLIKKTTGKKKLQNSIPKQTSQSHFLHLSTLRGWRSP